MGSRKGAREDGMLGLSWDSRRLNLPVKKHYWFLVIYECDILQRQSYVCHYALL